MSSDPTGLQVDELGKQLEQLTTERDQLVHALESRIVIEQAKGVLAERYGLPIDDAFLLLRRSARSARVKIHQLADEVVHTGETPQAVVRGLARESKLPAAAMRERTEASDERTEELRSAYAASSACGSASG
jgi:hypothetical protein